MATDPNLQQPKHRTASLALLPSELATVACVVWAAGRLYSPGSVTIAFQAWAVGLWLLVLLAALWPQPRWGGTFCRCLGGAAVVLLARAACPALGWTSALALGIMLGVVLAVTRRLLRWAAGGGPLTWADGWRGAGLQGVTAYALQTYVVSAKVGSGDAYHYSLMLADAVGQLRAGIFPLFVGQTPFAFNGNIHTLRTAPLYEYFGGGLDFLTLHTVPIFGLQGLVLLSAAGLGAFGCYAALRRYVPDRPWESAGLAALYVLSPGVLAPLYEGDMIATFLTVPILPWLVVCLAQAADEPEKRAPWIGQAAALAALWWAHPPVAFWSTLLVLGAGFFCLLRARWPAQSVLRIAFAALVFGVLAGYVFVSVKTLDLRPDGSTAAERIKNVMISDREGWRSSLLPLTETSYMGGIQLGYSLMAGALLGLLALRSRRSAPVLMAGMAAFLVLLYPIPGLTFWLWSRAPQSVLVVTNNWPLQRFYVVLAALAAFAALAGLSRISRRRPAAALVAIGFAAALAWSAVQAHTLILHGRGVLSTREDSERSHRPDNLTLTRSSYLIFNFFPPYFSHGVMTPLLETRLIDRKTFDVVADGSTPVSGQSGRTEATVELKGPGAQNQLSPVIPLAAGHTSLLRFDFLGGQPQGVLQMTDPTLVREYILPSSGMENSFGAGPANGRVIAITNDSGKPEDATLLFYATKAAYDPKGTFAKVTVEWLDSVSRAIELRSLLPFEAVVRAEHPAFLETPKVFIPGYSATVNGKPVAVVKSGNGLVAVPVPAGTTQVRVDYPGTLSLRIAFWASAAGWISLAVAFLFAPWSEFARGGPLWDEKREARIRGVLWRRGVPALAALALASAGYGLAHRTGRALGRPVHLVLMLPWAKPGSAEPLVTTGRTGAGDIVYLKYLGAGQVAVGHDKWGYGGLVSAPIEVDPARPQTVDIAMGSLGAAHGVNVRWNGREVLNERAETYAPDPAGKVEIGANSIGGSTCQAAFSGTILESTRKTPASDEASSAAAPRK